MTPEQFRQIDELYQVARERSPEDRAVLLASVDPELRREVESLLAQPTGGRFLDRPALEAVPPPLEDLTATMLSTGTRLGPYRIETKLGEGGMGEVFRAIDTRLGRAVAIKISHQQFSERFEREGRAISSLNHPNICTLYDVGPNYLVMELVEGETIAALLKNGPLSIETAKRYGAQIAAALSEAHGKGIIHRDLKPGNIMITKSGVKVLDFGLAKSEQDETITATRMVMGTPAYMAPEQREGKAADARSDIYSFGCVLYEMLTGKRVKQQRQPLASRALEKIVSRCLEQDPAQRWQTAAELERELGASTDTAKRWKLIALAAAAVLALFVGYFYSHRTPKLTDKDTIVLADFANQTGDPLFDGTLREGLSVQLEQSPFLSLVSDQRIQQVMGLMGQPADARLTPKIAHDVCERTASAAVLEGSIAPIGSQYVLGLTAKNCSTGDVLDKQQVQVPRKEDVLKALSEIATKFRARVGESLATVKKYDTPLEEASTPSLEALKAYSLALKVAYSTGFTSGLPLLKHAVEIDPKFAKAYSHLGIFYGNIGDFALATESQRKAYQLRDRTSERERFFITSNYDLQVIGDLEKAQQTCELWAQTYPRDKQPHGLLSSLVYQELGKYEKSIEQTKIAIGIDPNFTPGYVNQIWSDLYLDRLEDARSALQQASERKLETEDIFVLRYYIAFLKGDKAGMERAVALAQGKPVEDWVFDEEAFALAYSGHLQEARKMSRRAVDLARQADHKEKAAMYEAGAAVREAFYGNATEARQSAKAALDLSNDRDVEYGAAFALAVAGDPSRSQTLAEDLEKRFPEDTEARFIYVPTLRAVLALNKGESSKAIELLQTYDFAVPGSWFGFFGFMYPVYVRGEGYLAARRYAEAAAEFQKILDHRGLVFCDPVGAAAHLQLGRALALSGDKTKAKAAYQDFLTLWKDADPDIPILQQAKTEYAKLR